jgi:amino acid transporter
MGVYAFIFVLFVWIIGLTLGAVYFGDAEVEILGASISAATLLNLVLVLLTIAILYLALRRRDPEDLENPASDYNPVNWGYIWIVVSGILIVGIGAGAAMATRGGG